MVGDIAYLNPNWPGLSFGDLNRRMPQDLANGTLEIPDASLPRVVMNDFAQRVVGDLKLIVLQAVRLHLTANEIAARNLEFFAEGISSKADDLQPIPQRAGNCIQDIRGRDERPHG